MKKKISIYILAAALLLVGCGHEDKLQRYIETGDFGMIDTEKEGKEYNRKLDREDHCKWVYDNVKINRMLALEKAILDVAKEKGCVVSNDDVFEGKLVDWKKHAEKGRDPKDEKQKRVVINIDAKKSEHLVDVCHAIEKQGFPEVSQCIQNPHYEGLLTCQGLSFSYEQYDEEEVEDEYMYSLSIIISGSMGFYPEQYKNLLNMLEKQNYFVADIRCFGGAVNQVSTEFYHEGKLCNEVAFLLTADGTLLELDANIEKADCSKIHLESERNMFIEAITMLSGSKNDAISFVNKLEKKKAMGRVSENCSWSIKKMWIDDSYMLRVQ